MAIQVADGFSLQSQKPIDARLQFDTVANMKAAVENTLYDGCFAYVVENKKYYSFDSSNTVDTDTGKWREYSGGGSSYTAGDGINIDANDEISTDNMQSGDMDDVLATLPGLTSKYNVYSTTEQVVGEWINGKPIYQKTISGQMPNANDTVSIAHGISDLDIVVELDAIAHKPTTHKNLLLPIVGDGYNESYKKQSIISIASDYLYLRNYGDDYSAYTAYITMKYTKTTD